jgi:cobalt-zinc-cadmium efflux system membrane fusion protein
MFLPERDIASVRVGSPVYATIDAVPGQTFTGHIELIHTDIDPKTRSVEAHAEIVNPGTLRPGMFARGRIQTGAGALAVMVPADAVQKHEGRTVVFVAGEKPGEFRAREVATGATSGGRTIVRAGLKPGERVVTHGAFMVKAQAMKAELGHEH